MSLVKCCFDTPEISDVIESMVQKCTDPGCKYLQGVPFLTFYRIIKTIDMRFLRRCCDDVVHVFYAF